MKGGGLLLILISLFCNLILFAIKYDPQVKSVLSVIVVDSTPVVAWSSVSLSLSQHVRFSLHILSPIQLRREVIQQLGGHLAFIEDQTTRVA